MKKALSVLIMIIAGLIYVGISYAGPKEELDLRIKLNASQQLQMISQFKLLQIEKAALQMEFDRLMEQDKAKAPKKKENKPDKR